MTKEFMKIEMYEQVDVIERLIHRFQSIETEKLNRAIDVNEFSNVILSGCGDSHCAALAMQYAFKGEELLVQVLTPLELSKYHANIFNPKTIFIAISVSGKTPRVIEGIQKAKQKGAFVISISDNPNSPIAKNADYFLHTDTAPIEELTKTSYSGLGGKYDGYHHDVPQTKTYTANLVGLGLIGSLFTNNKSLITDIKKLKGGIRKIFSEQNYQELLAIFQKSFEAKKWVFVGSGPNYGTARYAAYKGYEYAFLSWGQEIEEFAHTQYFISDNESLVVFFAPKGSALERSKEIIPVLENEIESKIILITDEKTTITHNKITLPIQICEPLTPILYCLPPQILAFESAKYHGLDVNRFRGGIKTNKYVSGAFKTIRSSKMD